MTTDIPPIDAADRDADRQPGQNGEPLISIRELNHYYGSGETRSQVLKDVNLSVPAGELVIVEGPSGSGKSTLLVLIGTLRGVQEGSLRVGGTQLRGATPAQVLAIRRDIGFIFQAHNLFASLTAYENTKMGLQNSSRPGPQRLTRQAERQRIEGLLERLNLRGVGENGRPFNHIHKKPRQLSGGQRQRVAIARGLIHRPRVVLADEPTAALDPGMSDTVVGLLREHVSAGGTVMMVTHDTRVMQRADRIVTIEDGRIVQDVDLRESRKVAEFLNGVELFRHAPREAWLADIAAKMHRRRFAPGQPIIRQGDAGDEFYLIHSGGVRVLKSQPNGPPAEIASLGPGQFFGEQALISGEKRNATVVAGDEGALAYTLKEPEFRHLLEKNHNFGEQILRAVRTRA
jgi:putative ABC transport system ATP-binding protein